MPFARSDIHSPSSDVVPQGVVPALALAVEAQVAVVVAVAVVPLCPASVADVDVAPHSVKFAKRRRLLLEPPKTMRR